MEKNNNHRFGIALGAGGARGLAHICFLEAFEEFGIKPAVISGSSIGAVIGTVYASGMSAVDIREAIEDIVFTRNGRFWEIYKRSDLIKAFSFFSPDIKKGGLITGEKFINFLNEKLKVSQFSELKIPMKIVCTNIAANKEQVFSDGKLLKAVQASYAVPGLFSPVKIDNKYYIDGGVSNPLPYDAIINECDTCIAIDVSSGKSRRFTEVPPAYEVMFAGFSMQQRAIVKEKLKRIQPDIYIDTDIKDVRIHEFKKAKYIYKQVEPLKDLLRKKIEEILNNVESGKSEETP